MHLSLLTIYISWEMTPTSIGGENVLMITLRFFHWLSIHLPMRIVSLYQSNGSLFLQSFHAAGHGNVIKNFGNLSLLYIRHSKQCGISMFADKHQIN